MIALDSQWNTYTHNSKTLLYKGKVNMMLTDLCTTLDNDVFPTDIRGNFSFVFISSKGDVIFAAVDHFATYPLFYSDNFISQYFNDIKNTIGSYSTNTFIVDTINYFGGYSVGPETSITEISRLQPGYYLHDGVQIKYMDILVSDIPEGDYSNNARDALLRTTETIKDEITDSANLLLSGGKDSTLLLKLLLDSNANIYPISLISDYQIFSERKIISDF
jgi:asparagine synthetase B (glutamine-hydrolysing)